MDLTTVYIIATVLEFTGLLCGLGAYICRFWIFPPAYFHDSPIMRRWHHFLVANCVILTISTFGILITRSLIMAQGDYTDVMSLISTVLMQTHFGSHLFVAFAMLSILWTVVLISMYTKPERVNAGQIIAFVVMLIMSLMNTDISHAADQGDYTLKVFIDWLHIISAAGWGGSVIATVVCTFPYFSKLLEKPLYFAEMLERLSLVCLLSVLIIFISGIYNSWWLLGSFSALWQTYTGVILSIKLFFVFILLILGGVNRLFLIPRIDRWARSKTPTRAVSLIKITLLFDVILIPIVIILAAILIHSMPVMNMPTLPNNAPMQMPDMPDMKM